MDSFIFYFLIFQQQDLHPILTTRTTVGWSGVKDLTGGDPPLVSVVKRKYALTTQPPGSAGIDVAKAVHVMAHRMNLCRCGRYVPT